MQHAGKNVKKSKKYNSTIVVENLNAQVKYVKTCKSCT